MVIRLLAVGAIALLISGCGSSDVTQTIPVEERFQRAKALFDGGDYLDAINEFTVITLQHQGSAFAGDAQYYLGECRFKRGEYLLASYEYNLLKRNMPASPRVPDAHYKVGLSYYMLSPKSNLDQQYTRKAIDEFQAFVEYYPSHELALDADAKIRELTSRLAKKAYDTAVLYARMQSYRASLFYYDEVIERYHDTEYAPLAYLGKVEVLMERNRYEEASKAINTFIERFPQSVLRGRADALKEIIERELQKRSQVTGREHRGSEITGNRDGVVSRTAE
jgi:outer membrane protein assembly factor BamD